MTVTELLEQAAALAWQEGHDDAARLIDAARAEYEAWVQPLEQVDHFPWLAVWHGKHTTGRTDYPDRFSWDITSTEEGRDRFMRAFGQVPTLTHDPRS